MAQSFKETAHLKTDLNKYAENYDRIFGKKEDRADCNRCGSPMTKEEVEFYIHNCEDCEIADSFNDHSK